MSCWLRGVAALVTWLACTSVASAATASIAGTEIHTVAVLEFVSKGGISDAQAEALSDMVGNAIRATGVGKVIGMADIRAALQYAEKQHLLGCSDQSCLAELGGALGTRWVVVGNVSRFGNTWLLNLKLLDGQAVEVASGVSRSIEGGEERLVEAIPDAVRELLNGVTGLRQEGGMLFLKQRGGRFPVQVTVGLSSGIPPHRSNEDSHRADFEALAPLSEVYGSFHAQIFVGYTLWDWLSIGPRVGFIGGGDLKDGKRSLLAVDGALEIQGSLPLNYWLSPAFFIAGGVGQAFDSERGAGTNDFDSLTATLEIGLGGSMYLDDRWLIMGRLAAVETIFFSPHDATGRRLQSQLFSTSLRLMLTVGYEI